MGRKDSGAVEITTAPKSRSEEIAGRQRRYIISMAIRTLCFVGAVAVGPGWLRWVLVAGAFLLPAIAVVVANAAGTLNPGSPEAAGPDPQRRSLPGTTAP